MVVVIATLALCVAGVTIWSVVTVVGYAFGWQTLAALVLVLLALGLGTFALMRGRTR